MVRGIVLSIGVTVAACAMGWGQERPLQTKSDLDAAIAQAAPPVIDRVTESADGTRITISGNGFGTAPPKVKLGTTALTVTHSNSSAIVATLPANTAAGAYLLTVQNTTTKSSAVFAAAIGQIGPVGPVGAAGPKGAAGAAGPAGAQGPAGPKGATGAAGPAGAIGPQGPAGAKGDTGATGAQGPAGPQGATGPQGPAGTGRGVAGPRGPAGGQVWAASAYLPAETGSANWQIAPSGANSGIPLDTDNFMDRLLPVPQSCTVSNFNASATGGTHSGGGLVSLSFLDSGDLFSTSLSCELAVPAGGGDPVCSSATALQLTQGERIVLIFKPDTAGDYGNSSVFASFTCQ